ncbi:MAG: hypothetical protein KDI92_05755 [Xanthomonadales bacterium]|nr:hypothetical protein [Xanthomonadales bacterium]
MWIGTYFKWDPIPVYAGMRFDVEAVHDDWEGFRIWFRPHNQTKPMLIARFEDELFYASSDEGDRLSGAKNDIWDEFPHLFWKVDESELINEFVRQSKGIRDGSAIQHYCFMSCNQCVDVLSLSEPKFESGENDL